MYGNGVAVLSAEERLRQRLNEPGTAELLLQILDKLDVVHLAVSSLDGFLQRSDTIIENIASSVRGVRETAPVGDLDLISGAIEALPQMAATLPTIADRLPQLITVADQLQGLLNSAEVTALMGSGIFSPQTVAVVAHAGDALVESYNANQTAPKQVGLFGLLRALGDPDVQRGLGFLVDFGKRFGQQLENHHS